MMTISPNQPCPCGSGHHFRQCCANQIRPNAVLNLHSYPELFVVGAVLAGSKLFSAYYRSERARIGGEVLWVEDPKLPVGLGAAVTRIGTSHQVVRLRSVPGTAPDGAQIAHELEHLVLDWRGFPNVGSISEGEKGVATALAACLQDPVVDQHLQAFGLDLKEKSAREEAESQAALENCRAPTSKSDRMLWVINCASKIIDWAVAVGDGGKHRGAFELWFASRYPEIGAEARELAERMLALGFEESSTMQHALKQAVTTLGLQGRVKVVVLRPT